MIIFIFCFVDIFIVVNVFVLFVTFQISMSVLQTHVIMVVSALMGSTNIFVIQVLEMTEFLAVPLAVLHTSACISAQQICAVRFVVPLAGIHNLLCISSSGNGNQNNYKISARGDVIFWLHFRKRNCWIVYLQEGNVKFYVHLRLWGLWTWIITKSPLAGMQYFDCISASGTAGSGLYSCEGKCLCASPLAGPIWTWIITKSPLAGMQYFDFRKRNCRFWVVFPREEM